MENKLSSISTKELLEKFGAGNHKPGSGSASAFQGMLSCQMLRTVIGLTLEPKRKKNYQKSIYRLTVIMNEIENRVFPALERLFQLDSEQFDSVISFRNLRNAEQNFKKKRELATSSEEALILSTITPLDIADLCLELGWFAEFVFKNGFKSARGDSGVAINCSVSAVASCLSIVELNLITLPINEETEKIRRRKNRVKATYQRLFPVIEESLSTLETASERNRSFHYAIAEFQKGNLEETIGTNSDIESLARRLQNTLWLQRDIIWKNNSVKTPLDVLQADVAIEKVMGYNYQVSNSLGIFSQNDEFFEIAGIINKSDKIVQISKRFTQETRNFTTAHELGHALLHKRDILHRDKPLDGASGIPRSREEMEADKFATYFLMPGKLVEDLFIQMFETQKFIINEKSALAIRGGNMISLKRKCGNKRGLARLLATTEIYGRRTFKSLSQIFKVSSEAMAIRLEELDLLQF